MRIYIAIYISYLYYFNVYFSAYYLHSYIYVCVSVMHVQANAHSVPGLECILHKAVKISCHTNCHCGYLCRSRTCNKSDIDVTKLVFT